MGSLSRCICLLLLLAQLPNAQAGARLVPLGPIELGTSPPRDLFETQPPLPFPLAESPREARQIKPGVASRAWLAVLPTLEAADLSAYAVLYKGQLVTVDLSSPSTLVDLVRASLVSRYGKGVQQPVEESGVPPEGCEPWGLQYWQLSDGTNLYLVTGKESRGVSLQVRDVALYGLMEHDRAVHIESEQCIEF